jgi:hypothetical protein
MRIRVIIFHSIMFLQLFYGCKNQTTSPSSESDLQISFISGTAGGDFMPIIVPDSTNLPNPLQCKIVLVIKNINNDKIFEGLSIQQGEVYLSTTNTKIDTYNFSTNWSGRLAPNNSDTVCCTMTKSENSASVCGKTIYVNIFVQKDSTNVITFKTNDIHVQCVY